MSHEQFMGHLRRAPYYLIVAVAGIAAVVAIAMLFAWIVAGVLTVLFIAFLFWATGFSWTIRVDGKIIGHLRWFTFEPTPEYAEQQRAKKYDVSGSAGPGG